MTENNKRLHRNLVFAVIDGLHEIFVEGNYADKTIQKLLKRDKRWGAKDRDFIARSTYEIVRYKRLYDTIAQTKSHYSRENLWRIFAVWAVLKGIPLPHWKQLDDVPTRSIKGRFDGIQKNRKIRESIPDWLDDLGVKALGEKKWTAELKAQNTPADVVLRCNALLTTPKKLQALLKKEGIVTFLRKDYPDALILEKRQNVFQTAAFQSGLFEMQDASSQLVAPFLEVSNEMRVIDTCAGGGGKTLHLASLMQNKGQLIAIDVHSKKLQELKKRAKRARAFNIQTKTIEGSKTIKRYANTADRILIDAPCSGLGVLRRNPDAKWHLQPKFLAEIKEIQSDILNSYERMLKTGGKMVYATCSLLPEENQEQIAKFLENHPNFTLEKERALLSSEKGFDGFYMARLRKNA